MSDDYQMWQRAKEGAKVALLGYAQGDDDLALAGIEMLERSGSLGLFAACIGWAGIIKHEAKLTSESPTGYIGFHVAEVNIITGEFTPMEPNELDADMAPTMWAMRFVTAHVNGDRERCMDLFRTSTPGQLSMNITSLLELCAAHVRPLLSHGTD